MLLRRYRENAENTENEEKSEDESDMNYRDRAAERRQAEGSEVTTDSLLQKLSEDGQELDQKTIYEQSKYLGGDKEHTHLVKGLDFSLLERVRREMDGKKETEEMEEDAEDELDQVLTSSGDGDQTTQSMAMDTSIGMGDEAKGDEIEIASPIARRVYEKAVVEASKQTPLKNELFFAGRMAFVFELADDRGNYSAPFGIPTSVIRSKADLSHRGSRSSAEELDADAQLVIGKVVQVIANLKNGGQGAEMETKMEPPRKKPKREPTPERIVAMDDDDDIFADAGREYELEEEDETMEEKQGPKLSTGNYFEGISKSEPDDVDQEESEEQRKQNIAKILAASAAIHDVGEKEKKSQEKKKTVDASDMHIDMDADDYNTFGLGSEALPSTLDELKQAMAYDQQYEDSGEKATSSSLIDAGTHKNKKAQLTRWDFDDEEDWQRYKDNIEVLPKSAMQYGVKMSDGRKRNREQRKAPSDKQKLDREWQQLKSFMDKKKEE